MYSTMTVASRIVSLCESRFGKRKLRTMLKEIGSEYEYIVDNLKKGSMPSADKLGRIADKLSCTVDYLLGRTDTPDMPTSNIKINNAHVNNIVNSSNFNIGEFSLSDLDLLHLIQEIPIIERSKLICELDLKYNGKK